MLSKCNLYAELVPLWYSFTYLSTMLTKTIGCDEKQHHQCHHRTPRKSSYHSAKQHTCFSYIFSLIVSWWINVVSITITCLYIFIDTIWICDLHPLSRITLYPIMQTRESQAPPSTFKSTFTRIILGLLTGEYISR